MHGTPDDIPSSEAALETKRIGPEEHQWIVAWAFEMTNDHDAVTTRCGPQMLARISEPEIIASLPDVEIEEAVTDIGPVSLRPEEIARLRYGVEVV